MDDDDSFADAVPVRFCLLLVLHIMKDPGIGGGGCLICYRAPLAPFSRRRRLVIFVRVASLHFCCNVRPAECTTHVVFCCNVPTDVLPNIYTPSRERVYDIYSISLWKSSAKKKPTGSIVFLDLHTS